MARLKMFAKKKGEKARMNRRGKGREKR